MFLSNYRNSSILNIPSFENNGAITNLLTFRIGLILFRQQLFFLAEFETLQANKHKVKLFGESDNLLVITDINTLRLNPLSITYSSNISLLGINTSILEEQLGWLEIESPNYQPGNLIKFTPPLFLL
ncbi:MAG: hypothetical protein ACOC1X_02965 [Promethearchaeota archaeon]